VVLCSITREPARKISVDDKELRQKGIVNRDERSVTKTGAGRRSVDLQNKTKDEVGSYRNLNQVFQPERAEILCREGALRASSQK